MTKELNQAKKFLLENTKYVNELRLKRNKAKTKREKQAYQILIDIQDDINKRAKVEISKIEQGLKKPTTKGLTTFCAKTVGTSGRRKKDGSVKKGYVTKKGGKVVPVKKKTSANKGLKGVVRKDKYLIKFWKDKEVIKETKAKTKVEAEKLKRNYLSSFHITKRVAEKRQATISKL